VFSNTTAAAYPAEPAAIVDLLTRHLVCPVRFTEEVEAMYAAGARIFVEAGPRNVLTTLVRNILGDRPHAAIAVDQPGRPGLPQFLSALGELAAHGVRIRPTALFQARAVTALNLQPTSRLDLSPVRVP